MSSAYITLARVIVIQLYLAAQEVNKMECYLGTQIFYYYYKRREEQIWKTVVVSTTSKTKYTSKTLFIRQEEELALFLIGGRESRRGEKESRKMVEAMTLF